MGRHNRKHARNRGRKFLLRLVLRGLVTAVACIGVAWPAPSQVALGQAADESKVKAAFVYHFAKFTDWPAEAFTGADETVVLCVVGSHDYGDAFDSVAGKAVGGRAVEVKYVRSYKPNEQCHVVFVAKSERTKVERIVAQSQEWHALTVSDIEGFTDRCGMIGLVRLNDRLAFEINQAAAETAGLKLSSKLLNLAKRLVEGQCKP